MFLTVSEIEQLTGRKRPTHQARQLELMGIPFLRPPRVGKARAPVVLRSAVEGLVPTVKMAAEPKLRLPR
jgi:hypothetical protein